MVIFPDSQKDTTITHTHGWSYGHYGHLCYVSELRWCWFYREKCPATGGTTRAKLAFCPGAVLSPLWVTFIIRCLLLLVHSSQWSRKDTYSFPGWDRSWGRSPNILLALALGFGLFLFCIFTQRFLEVFRSIPQVFLAPQIVTTQLNCLSFSLTLLDLRSDSFFASRTDHHISNFCSKRHHSNW